MILNYCLNQFLNIRVIMMTCYLSFSIVPSATPQNWNLVFTFFIHGFSLVPFSLIAVSLIKLVRWIRHRIWYPFPLPLIVFDKIFLTILFPKTYIYICLPVLSLMIFLTRLPIIYGLLTVFRWLLSTPPLCYLIIVWMSVSTRCSYSPFQKCL